MSFQELPAPVAPAHLQAHGLNMRKKWNSKTPEERAKHIEQPAHLYAYMSGFVPPGVTEGRISQFFKSINHLGAFADGAATKLTLSSATCVTIVPALDALSNAPLSADLSAVGEHALNSIMVIHSLVEADVAAQGWSYNYAQNFAYRTPHASGAPARFY